MSDHTQPAWLTEAWPLLGLAEQPGSRSNPRIIDLYRDAGHPNVRRDSVAWCAAFVGACLKRAAITPTGSLRARSYRTFGERIDAPRVGAIAIFSRGADPSLGHVAFVVGETDTHIAVLGGNQNDAVTVGLYPRASLLDLRWPPTAEERATPPAIFDRALAHVLDMEGGYTDDPHDPGGPTNLGITLAVYADWRGIDVTPDTFATLKADLRTIDRATVAEIYTQRYWTRSCANTMPNALALMHFDAAVNHGVTGSTRILQQALGVDVDGDIGDDTRAAIAAASLPELIDRYADLRIARYRALPHFWRFGRGWLNRVAKTRAAAKSLIPSPTPNTDTPNSMTTVPTNPAPKWWGASMTIWGVIMTGLTTVLPAIGPLFGLDITGEMIVAFGHSVTALLQAIGGVAGTIMAIYGRMRASQPLMRRDVALRV